MDKPRSAPESNRFFVRAFSRVLRVFFNLLYNQFAWTYDYVSAAVSLGRWKIWINTLLPYLEPGSTYLELGHGPGHLQAAGLNNRSRMVGIDASQSMGQIAYQRVIDLDFQPEFANGYAQFMPFLTGCFHGVLATFPTEYISDPQTVAEINRVLRPKGTLLIIPAAWIEGGSLPDRFLARLFQITHQAPDPLDSGLLEPLQTYLSQAGFDVQLDKISVQKSSVLVIKATKSR